MKLIAALTAFLCLAGSAFAEDAVKCPVSGKPVDAAITTTVKVSVGLCCSKCQAKFEGDEKMKADALKKYVGTKDDPANKKCPVSSKDTNTANVVKVEKSVAFCCDKCKTAFEADPKKYFSKVK